MDSMWIQFVNNIDWKRVWTYVWRINTNFIRKWNGMWLCIIIQTFFISFEMCYSLLAANEKKRTMSEMDVHVQATESGWHDSWGLVRQNTTCNWRETYYYWLLVHHRDTIISNKLNVSHDEFNVYGLLWFPV